MFARRQRRMATSLSSQPVSQSTRRFRLFTMFPATVILFCIAGFAAPPQATTSSQGTRSSAKAQAPSPFWEAESLLAQGSVEEAKQKVQEQLQLHPRSVEGYNLLGIVFTSEKNPMQALDSFQHALQLDPNSTRTHNNLGNFYVSQEKVDLAEKEFRTVLRLDPTNRDANYNLGLLLMAKHSPAQAIPLFRKVHPQNIETRFNLT